MPSVVAHWAGLIAWRENSRYSESMSSLRDITRLCQPAILGGLLLLLLRPARR